MTCSGVGVSVPRRMRAARVSHVCRVCADAMLIARCLLSPHLAEIAFNGAALVSPQYRIIHPHTYRAIVPLCAGSLITKGLKKDTLVLYKVTKVSVCRQIRMTL